MAVQITKAIQSDTGTAGKNPSFNVELTLRYNDESFYQLVNAIKSGGYAPNTVSVAAGQTLVLQDIELAKVESVTTVGATKWRIRRAHVRYGESEEQETWEPPPGSGEVRPPTFNFSVTAQQVKTLVARKQRAFDKNGPTVEYDYVTDSSGNVITDSQGNPAVWGERENDPFNGAIGVTGPPGNRRAEGVSVFTPVIQWQDVRTYRWDAIQMPQFLVNLNNYVGHVNSTTFQNFPAGSVLLLGVSGTQESASRFSNWGLQFQAQVSPNQGSMNVGGITVIDVGGWDYVWAHYDEYASVDVNTGLILNATYAFVSQVYPRANLNDIFF